MKTLLVIVFAEALEGAVWRRALEWIHGDARISSLEMVNRVVISLAREGERSRSFA